MSTSARRILLEIAESLDSNATLDDAMDLLYVRRKIQSGLNDAAASRVVPHEQVFTEFPGHDVDDRRTGWPSPTAEVKC